MRSEQEQREERLRVAAQLMAAILPKMVQHTPYEVAQTAVGLADALIEVVDA